MPFDGNGNYRFPVNSWNPAVNGNQASAQDWMAIINDLSTSLSSVVLADGQKMMTGNLRMGGFKLTGIGAAVDPTDAIRRSQIQKGAEITSAATIEIPSEGSLFSVNGDKNLEGINGGYDGQSFALVFSNAVTLKNSERLKTSTGLDIKVVAGHPYNFVRLATDNWFVFEINQNAAAVPFNPEGDIAATNVQAAIKELDDEKQPKGDYQTALGYTPVNKAGDQMTGNLSIKKSIPTIGLVSDTGGVSWEIRGNFTGATDYGVQFWNIAQNAQIFRIGGEGQKEVFVRGHHAWHAGNFNPDTKAPTGKDCVWQSDAFETGGSVSPGGTYAYNLPAGYVVVGARTQSGVNSIWFRAVKIGTPQA